MPLAMATICSLDLGRQLDAGPLVQELARRAGIEARDAQLRQAGPVEAADVVVAGREHDADGLGVEPAGGERQGVGRRRVEPVGIVDDGEHGRGLRGHGKEAQHRGADQEAVVTGRRVEAERAAQGRRLAGGDLVERVKQRPHKLVDARKCELDSASTPVARSTCMSPSGLGRPARPEAARTSRLPGSPRSTEQAPLLPGAHPRRGARAEPFSLGVPPVQHEPIRARPRRTYGRLAREAVPGDPLVIDPAIPPGRSRPDRADDPRCPRYSSKEGALPMLHRISTASTRRPWLVIWPPGSPC